MRKLLIGFMVVLVIGAAVYLRFHHSKAPVEVGYAGNSGVTVWSTTAQVRERVATLNYGDRVEILDRSQDQAQVRTATDVTGWVTGDDLLSPDLWRRAKGLESRTANSPVEAHGHTRAISNLHIESGRESARIRQLNKAIPVDLFERQVVEAPASPMPNDKAAAPAAPRETTPPPARKEDWWLVRAHLTDQTTVSGWILGRFVDLDVPPPLPDYASSAGMRIVAWFELNDVADASGGVKPQYLVLGNRGPEGQSCDFVLMRVYTWGNQGQRYETAFVESDVCGKLPVKLTQSATPGGDVTFSFEDWSSGAAEQRTYQMHQTVVRRQREAGLATAKRKHAHG